MMNAASPTISAHCATGPIVQTSSVIYAVDAQLDREASLSERNAFLLGRDLGRRRMDAPTDGQGRMHWPNDEMERGYAIGLELQAQHGDVYLRKRAHTRSEGSACARRKTLFKRLGATSWHLSNRLVEVIRFQLARCTHPADVWLDGDPSILLHDLMNSFMADPPQFEHVDPRSLAQMMNAGLEPIRQYAR